jgi:hypothetical protein
MSELAIIQRSTFQEILKEELEAIKKQLTESQINLLCGPRESVKAALNEIGLGRDVIFSNAHDIAAHEDLRAQIEGEIAFNVSHEQAEEQIRNAFGRIQDINDPKDWEIQNALIVIIYNLWDDTAAGNSDWNDLKWIRQDKLRQVLRTITIDETSATSAWEIVDPFVRFRDEKLADDTVLRFRDWIINSDLLAMVDGIATIGAVAATLIGSPVVATIGFGIAARILVVRGIAMLSAANSLDDVLGAVFEIFLAAAARGAAGISNLATKSVLPSLNGILVMGRTKFIAGLKEVSVKFPNKFRALVRGMLDFIAVIGDYFLIAHEWERATRVPIVWQIQSRHPFGDSWVGDFFEWAARRRGAIDANDPIWSENLAPPEQAALATIAEALESQEVTVDQVNKTITAPNDDNAELTTALTDLHFIPAEQAEDIPANAEIAQEDMDRALHNAIDIVNLNGEQLRIQALEDLNDLRETVFDSYRFQKLANI